MTDAILHFAAWQKTNRKIAAILYAGSGILWNFLKLANRAVFASNIFETILTIGLYLWLASVIAWIVYELNPLLAEYIRRRQAGEPCENALLYEARRPLTGNIWLDAVVFLGVIIGGVAFVVFYIYHM